jgi:hypothetical protein
MYSHNQNFTGRFRANLSRNPDDGHQEQKKETFFFSRHQLGSKPGLPDLS